ncbi:MAG: T9SS C-terminal target domain-containing protein [Bacteroidetes bacterium]|nr:MAG: T9SS C-terminal target domain-containing protein [Bacteroidota bacterium]
MKYRNTSTILQAKRLLLFSFCLSFWAFSEGAIAQQISINEFMSSNGSVIADEDGDYEDWIELFNYGSEPVNLNGFFLSDDYGDPYKWKFPGVVVHPGDYLLVWASGKNRRNASLPLHTNFSIVRNGEELILTSPDGTRIDELKPVYLNRNSSFARYPDGTGSWLFSLNPTPGAPNEPHPSGDMPVHFWLFDSNIPNNTPLEALDPAYSLVPGGYIRYVSCLEGYPFHQEHPFWRKASMERRNKPISLNYLPEINNHLPFGEAGVRGLQIKQPFYHQGQQNTMIFHAPATGFSNIIFRFAAIDEGAADKLQIAYNIDPSGTNWIPLPEFMSPFILGDQYLLFQADFSDIHGVSNNADFKIRIRFEGYDMEADEGNRVTFNNISLSGTPLPIHYVNITAGRNGMVAPFGFTPIFDREDIAITFYPTQNYVVDTLWVNGKDFTDQISTDPFNVSVLFLEKITENTSVHANFALDEMYIESQPGRVLVYPNPSFLGDIHLKSTDWIHELKVFDSTGALVMRQPIENHHYTLRLDVRRGMYLFRIRTSEGVVFKKVQVLN